MSTERETRTIRVGTSVLITDHPTMPSLIGKTGRAVQLPNVYSGPGVWPKPRSELPAFIGHDETLTRIWVRLDGNDEIEYGVPFNCLLFEDGEADEVA